MAIRRSTELELRKAVRNYNSKISRLEKKGINATLPERVSLKDIKGRPSQDVRKQLKTLERFTKRGSEAVVEYNGIQITKFERKEIANQLRSVNMRRSIRRKKGDLENTNKKIHPRIRNISELRKFEKSLGRESASNFDEIRYQTYKDNYIKALEEELGSLGTKTRLLVQKLDPKTVYEMGQSQPDLNIKFIYDPEEAKKIAENLYQSWVLVK